MKSKRRKLKRKWPFVICCVLLLTALLACGYELFKNDFFLPGLGKDTVAEAVEDGQRLNVLLLGVDAREGENEARSDTIILASVDIKTKQMALLSIPRDTRVNIPGYGWDKINSASVYGGPNLSMKVASNLLGIPVKYYVKADFNGFENIVDVLGGVTLNVEQDMYHEDETDGYAYEINLEKGVQRLDGDKALQYVRYRDYAMGDIDRTAHQQKFLIALAKEVMQPSTILKLPALVPEINKYVKTNLSVSDMMTLASAAKKLENGKIVAQTLPGRPMNIGGGSYWGVDPDEARQMVANLFNGQTATDVVLTTPLDGMPVDTGEDEQPADEKASTTSDGKTQLNQTGDKTLIKPGQKTTNSGSISGSSNTVIITPIDEIEESKETGTTSGSKTGTGTSGTGTGTSGTSQGTGTSGTDGYNPGIPGTTKTNISG